MNTSDKIVQILDEHINPMLELHGGEASLQGYDEAKCIAYIEFEGGCQGCAGAKITLGRYIKATIMNTITEVKDVIDATNHAAGQNPYYKKEDLNEDA